MRGSTHFYGGPLVLPCRSGPQGQLVVIEDADQSSRVWWLDPAHYLRSWNKRARFAAPFCGNGWVCDIGCGMQGLSRFLPLRSRYLPSDLKQWTPDVEVCDLNAGVLPDRYLALCDVVTLLGVVERIHDLDWLFAELATRAERLIVTYHCSDNAPMRMPGWINAYTSAEFSTKLVAAGYRVEDSEMFDDQTVFVARSSLF